MVAGTMGSHSKDGSTKMKQLITTVAGIDTGKAFLDVAILDAATGVEQASFRALNTAAGFTEVVERLSTAGVERVGIEATGGYEREAVAALHRAGLQVLVHQPLQVRLYARLKLRRAKNDRLDASIIAAFTAITEPRPKIADVTQNAVLQALHDHLVHIDDMVEDVARLKTRLEHRRDPRLIAEIKDDIAALNRRIASERRQLEKEVRVHPDLARRLDLASSVPGIGKPTALSMVIDMPELGHVSREQAAALIGLAPFDHDSGNQRGLRHIAGGRARPRKALYAAALPAAFKWNPQLVALYNRLIAKGKKHKCALVACARKLVIYVNTVLARNIPWTA